MRTRIDRCQSEEGRIQMSLPHNPEWMRRRWLDFRNGHSIYLIFLLTFVNFVVITYTLAIERFEFLEGIFPSMWTWGTVFVLAYIPAAIIIGHLHRKFQIPTETRQLMDANPFIYHVQPGREKLFNMPVSVLSFEAQVHSMRMQNAMADAIEKLVANTSTAIPAIPRFDQSFFREYERAIHITERLARGDSILDILESLKTQGATIEQQRRR